MSKESKHDSRTQRGKSASPVGDQHDNPSSKHQKISTPRCRCAICSMRGINTTFT